MSKTTSDEPDWPDLCSRIPAKTWAMLFRSTPKNVRVHAEKHGIDMAGDVVNLFTVIPALRSVIECLEAKLAAGDDMMADATASPALEEYRRERVLILRMDRKLREGSLIHRDDLQEGFSMMVAILRSIGDDLERQFGPSALAILHAGLGELEEAVKRMTIIDEDPEGS